MKKNITEKNELLCCCDWLDFTIFDLDSELSEIENVHFYISYFGLDVSEFNLMQKGLMGYRSLLRHSSENIFVCFNGNENMGIHFRMSGSSVSYCIKAYLESKLSDTPFPDLKYYDIDCDAEYIFVSFLERILSVGSLTRIDLSIDDIGNKYYYCSEIEEKLNNKEFVSKFRSWEAIKSFHTDGTPKGYTVYMGTRQSEVYLRVYDKKLEQNVSFDWVRWELEIKGDKADVVAKELIERKSFCTVALGILSNYVRFIVLDNDRKCRCSVDDMWQHFVDDCEKIRLVLPEKYRSVEQKMEWLDKQVKPTIAGLLVACNGDIGAILGDLSGHYNRLKQKDKIMFESYQMA